MEYVSPDRCLFPGYPLQLEFIDELTDAPAAGIYASMVIGLEADLVHVDIPKLDGEYVHLPVDTPLHVVQLAEDALYSFDATVLGYEWELPIALCLSRPDSVLRSQRRETVRVPTDLIGRVGHDGTDLGVTLRDISAGGVSFFCAQPLQGLIDMALNLASGRGQDWISLQLLVRRVVPVRSEYIVACSFADLDRKDEDRIVSYLFRRQRQLRQNGG